jgi:hypothetical protein
MSISDIANIRNDVDAPPLHGQKRCPVKLVLFQNDWNWIWNKSWHYRKLKDSFVLILFKWNSQVLFLWLVWNSRKVCSNHKHFLSYLPFPAFPMSSTLSPPHLFCLTFPPLPLSPFPSLPFFSWSLVTLFARSSVFTPPPPQTSLFQSIISHRLADSTFPVLPTLAKYIYTVQCTPRGVVRE